VRLPCCSFQPEAPRHLCNSATALVQNGSAPPNRAFARKEAIRQRHVQSLSLPPFRPSRGRAYLGTTATIDTTTPHPAALTKHQRVSRTVHFASRSPTATRAQTTTTHNTSKPRDSLPSPTNIARLLLSTEVAHVFTCTYCRHPVKQTILQVAAPLFKS